MEDRAVTGNSIKNQQAASTRRGLLILVGHARLRRVNPDRLTKAIERMPAAMLYPRP